MGATLQGAKNLEFLSENFDFEKSAKQEKQGFVLEGGSGSAKTWDIVQFLMYYCELNRDKSKDILIARQTYADLKKTVLKDFVKILVKYNLYDECLHTKSNPQSYNLFGNTIFFTGLEAMGAHGERHDIIWINEGMEAEFQVFQQLNQRCNEAFFIDYNPCFTEHWIFNNVLTRPDVKFCQSTQLDNPFLPKGQRDEILAYEPTAANIKNGTADDYMWKVYGLGIRAAARGLIFQNVTWIDSFPKDIKYMYGLDFGYTNDPTAIVKVGVSTSGIYAELLCYEPIDNAQTIADFLKGIKIYHSDRITADSADKYNDTSMVTDLQNLGWWNVVKVDKGKGINWRIGLMKKHKIHIVRNVNAKREQENYKWREVNGILTNQPIDKFNHFWDAFGYGYLGLHEGDFTIRRIN